jgi:hypothetical protein
MTRGACISFACLRNAVRWRRLTAKNEPNGVSARTVLNFVHQLTDEKYASPTGPFEILRESGIRYGGRIEAATFVPNLDLHSRAVHGYRHSDSLVRVLLVSVQHGVGERFRDADPEVEQESRSIELVRPAALHQIGDGALDHLRIAGQLENEPLQ